MVVVASAPHLTNTSVTVHTDHIIPRNRQSFFGTQKPPQQREHSPREARIPELTRDRRDRVHFAMMVQHAELRGVEQEVQHSLASLQRHGRIIDRYGGAEGYIAPSRWK